MSHLYAVASVSRLLDGTLNIHQCFVITDGEIRVGTAESICVKQVPRVMIQQISETSCFRKVPPPHTEESTSPPTTLRGRFRESEPDLNGNVSFRDETDDNGKLWLLELAPGFRPVARKPGLLTLRDGRVAVSFTPDTPDMPEGIPMEPLPRNPVEARHSMLLADVAGTRSRLLEILGEDLDDATMPTQRMAQEVATLVGGLRAEIKTLKDHLTRLETAALKRARKTKSGTRQK